jgi:hypothetical protein
MYFIKTPTFKECLAYFSKMLNLFRKIQNIVAQIDTQLPGNSFLFQRIAFMLVGMWPPLDNWNETRHLLTKNPRYYHIFSIIVIVSFLYISIGFQVINLFFVTNIGDLAEAAFLFVTQLVAIFKVQRFNSHYRKIRILLDTINEIKFRPKDDVEKK